MNDELRVKNNELGGKMNYRYRNDEEMKDSGVEWIGKIPIQWKVKRVKHIFELKKERSDIDNPVILSLTQKGIKVRDISNNEGQIAASYLGYTKIAKNDFVLNPMDLLSGYIDKAEIEGVISPAYTTFAKKRKVKITHDYYKQYFQMHYHHNFLFPWGEGVSFEHRWTLKNETFLNLPVIEPCVLEQEKISKFLDVKTAQFDSIISKKEALIEKLEEAKKSLISEVVTGKVKVVKTNDGYELVERKKEEMKDSGVEWLEDIPKEWDLKRSNYVFKFSKGLSITKENLQDEGIPCINYGEIHSKYGFEVNPKRHKLKCVTEEYFNSNPNALIKYGHFVFADTSEDIQGCGNFSYLNAEDSIFAGYHTIIVRPIKTVSSRYLAYLFDSDDWRIQIRTKVSGIKVFSITQSILKTTKVILPTLSEQKLIVDYLDNKFVNINSMINNMKKQIEKLKEAKQSLISEAVTGKIEILD